MTSLDELSAIAPENHTVTLAGGVDVSIERLKARQFFKLLRIVTHGAMPILSDMRMLPDPSGDREQFVAKLVSMILMSIPDAEDETIDFLKSMCTPVGLRQGGRKASKEDIEYNTELWTRLDDALHNPELDDLITIVEAIVKAEADDIQALGKRLTAMFKLAEKTGQVPAAQNRSPTPTSSEPSPEPSTSSPASTDGPTTS